MTNVGGVSGDYLRSYIERIENLEQTKAEVAEDIRDVYAEAKGNGFIPAIMREIIKQRKKDANEREEAEYLMDVYQMALGMKPVEVE